MTEFRLMFKLTLYIWSTNCNISALIQFGQCTSQKLADTNVVNSTYPGDEDIEKEDLAERGLSDDFGLRFTFARCLLGVP